jgi:hypothetical protein
MSELSGRLFSFAKSAVFVGVIAAPMTGAAVFACQNPNAILSLLSRVQSLEIGDVKLAFGAKAFDLNPDLKKSRSDRGDQLRLMERVAGLGPNEVDRLLHMSEIGKDRIGDIGVSCEYDDADSRMRFFAAADQALVEKALAERVSRADLTDKARAARRSPARNCYQLVLTRDGADMKSLIVSEVTRFFRDGVEGAVDAAPEKPAPEKREKLSRRGERALLAAR